MSATTGSIRIGIDPRARVRQAVVLAALILVGLLSGLLVGRATAPSVIAPAQQVATLDLADLAGAFGKGHVAPRPEFDPGAYIGSRGQGHRL